MEGTQRSSAAPLKSRSAAGTHEPRRSPLTARWLASAAPDRPVLPQPGWRAAGLRELGRGSSPSAQVEVESDRGQDVADGVQCVVRGDHAGDEGQDSQGDRRHDRSAAVHPRRRSMGPGRRPAGTIAAEVETAGGRTTSRSGTSSGSRAPCGPHPTSAAPLPRRPFSSPPSRSQNDPFPHSRLRPERVETTCTDWHLPPMAKGASRACSLTFRGQSAEFPSSSSRPWRSARLGSIWKNSCDSASCGTTCRRMESG